MPRMAGRGGRACAAWPPRILVSSGLTPLAWALTSTSPGAGFGLSTDAMLNGSFGPSSTAACIELLSVIVVDALFCDRIGQRGSEFIRLCWRPSRVRRFRGDCVQRARQRVDHGL